MTDMRAIAETSGTTPDEFRGSILPLGRPAVLRGIAAGWPFVLIARRDPGRLLSVMANSASQKTTSYIHAEPTLEGRFHYAEDGETLNFSRGLATLPEFLSGLIGEGAAETPQAMAVQGLPADVHIPGFTRYHAMPFVPPGTAPRLWIGNAAKVATHNDPVANIAVVVAGRRRFTLFPPEAEPNLYMGPAHPTPAGTPVSMVHVTAPDLDRYPRYDAALEVAEEAELLPGDAIYIPKSWFHHVESLERFNMLANYWWDADAKHSPPSATSLATR